MEHSLGFYMSSKITVHQLIKRSILETLYEFKKS